jgi:hypothetical protein
MKTVPVTNMLQDAPHQTLAAIGLERVLLQLVRKNHVLNSQKMMTAPSSHWQIMNQSLANGSQIQKHASMVWLQTYPKISALNRL